MFFVVPFSELILPDDPLVYYSPSTVCDNDVVNSDDSDADTERRKNVSRCRDAIKPNMDANDDDDDDDMDDATDKRMRSSRPSMPESAVSMNASSTSTTEPTTSSNSGEGTTSQRAITALSKF